jgi:molybdenum cofactor cytidylyltransferase
MDSHVIHRSSWSAVVPAAGASRRFGSGNKLLQRLAGRTVIERVVESAARCGPDCIVVVTGEAHDEVKKLSAPFGAACVFNAEHHRGMGRSIALGVAAAAERAESGSAFVIWPGDMPWIAPETVNAVVSAEVPGRIVIPVYAGRRGHPVFFSATFATELMRLDGDRGARSVIERHPESVIELAVEDAAIHRDVDTKEDLPGMRSDQPSGADMRR